MALLISLLNTPSYSAERNVDVVLLMDSSGSMKYTDPMTMRIPAAKMFVSLLGENDRVSVVTFGAKSRRLTPLTYARNDQQKKVLFEAIDSVSSDEALTNLHAAVSEALEILSDSDPNKEAAPIIIIMSDGKMDAGDSEKDQRLIRELRKEVLSRLKDRQIRLFSLAFTEQSDRKLLEELSRKTGGQFSYTSSDRDLHLIYASIFESLKEPDMLPLQDNRFAIDTSIDEVTIIATKESADTKIVIRSPSGAKYFSDYGDDYIKWFTSKNFDMATIQAPDQGTWDILFSSGNNNKAYIVTDLKLVSDFNKISVLIGDAFNLKFWLEREGKPVAKGSILHDVEASIEMKRPDGSNLAIPLHGEIDAGKSSYGFVSGTIKPDQSGDYKINVIVKSKTFQRQKRYAFSVVDNEDDRIDFIPRKDSAKPADQTTLDSEEVPEASPASNISTFLSINIILIGLFSAYYFLIKRRAPAKPDAAASPEETKRKTLTGFFRTILRKKGKKDNDG